MCCAHTSIMRRGNCRMPKRSLTSIPWRRPPELSYLMLSRCCIFPGTWKCWCGGRRSSDLPQRLRRGEKKIPRRAMLHFLLSLHSAHLSEPCRFRAEKRIVFCLKAMAKTNSVLNKNSVLNQNCGSRKVLEIVTGKWTVLVLYALGERPLRYADLRRGIEGISQKMLTQTLRRLQRDGLVERRSVRANSHPAAHTRRCSRPKTRRRWKARAPCNLARSARNTRSSPGERNLWR